MRTLSSVNSPLFGEKSELRREDEEQPITARQIAAVTVMEKLRITYNVVDLGGKTISFVAGALVSGTGSK